MEHRKMRIALVNQRYGLEVNGGSEYYTRQLAEHLSKDYDVEILTTKALGYDTWKDYYPKSVEDIQGVTVRRFHVAKTRNALAMKVYERLMRYCLAGRNFWEERWMDAQGPYCPELVSYIEQHAEEYTVFIFVTYLYYQTVRGIPKAGDRSVLIPTAHDEPYIYFNLFKRVFAAPRGLIYLTQEEKTFVESMFPVSQKPNCICGAGVELPENVDNLAYRKKYAIDGDYLIYVGRIDESKGCKEMFHAFLAYKKKFPDKKLKLILMGKAELAVPEDEDIIAHGFVSEEDKFNGISGACALWLPSKYESLSIAVLEAMALGVPVLVNGDCAVLRGHCERSKAGFYYHTEEQAMQQISCLQSKADREQMAERARKYIEENYQWDTIVRKVETLVATISN